MSAPETATLAAIGILLALAAYLVYRRGSFCLPVAVAAIAVFMVETVTTPFWGVAYFSPAAWELGFDPAYIYGEPHLFLLTMVTHMFIHADPLHLFFNIVALLFLGVLLEQRVGSLKCAAVFLVCGVLSAVLFGALYGMVHMRIWGASAAISGILGVLGRLYPGEKVSMFLYFIFIPVALPLYVWVLVFLAMETLFTFTGNIFFFMTGGGGNIAFAAHIIGLLLGFFLAPLFMWIPAGKAVHRAKAPAVAVLRELAKTPKQREALGRIEKEEVEEVRRAWVEEFLREARCPGCGGGIAVGRGGAKCAKGCGYRVGR